MKLKKAAMFGLDARIALAIFGALSVISGAALYSAIQDAKQTALYTELKEIEKAIEQLLLDVGYLPSFGTFSAFFVTTSLLNDIGSYKGWNGPYLTNFKANYSSNSTSIGSSTDKMRFDITHTDNDASRDCVSDGGSLLDDPYYIKLIKYNSENNEIDYNFLKSFHDTYDSDGDYSTGSIVVREQTTGKGCLLYKLPEGLMRPNM